jgi:hypothetical protein
MQLGILRIDRVDPTAITKFAQETERFPADSPEVSGGAEHGDRSGIEQGIE